MTPLNSNRANRTRRKKGTGNVFGLSFEALEDRRMLAAITVNTAADLVDGNTTSISGLIANPGADGAISLREALVAADRTSDTDTITFDADVFNGEADDVIRLQSPLTVFRSVQIEGGDADVVISGDSLGNDITETGSFITDTVASEAAGVLADNTDGIFSFMGGFGSISNSSLVRLTITGGSAENGGGILSRSTNLDLFQSVVSGNRSTVSGGGIDFNFSHLSITQSTISGNVVQSPTSLTNATGGGIATASNADLFVIESTISDNLADGEVGQGGGVYSDSGSLQIFNSTISGNTASSPFAAGEGGGVFAQSQTLIVDGSTITANTADLGGGISVDDPSSSVPVTLRGSIIASNTALSANADIDVGVGTTIDAFSSLIGDNSGSMLDPSTGSSFPRNQIGTSAAPIDPLLFELADNGGPTQTHALSPTSPAVDAGNNSRLSDQRGEPGFGPSDIGAFELQGTFIIVDSSEGFFDGDFSPGDLSLPEAISFVNGTSEIDTIAFDPSVFNAEADDVIRLEQELFIAQAVTIDTFGLDVVVSGDAFGDDLLTPGTFVTDIENNFNNSDNVTPFVIEIGLGNFVTLRGLTITGGENDFGFGGGAIASRSGSLVIDDSVISGNLSSNRDGGGVSIRDGSLFVSNSVFSNNRASGVGGGIFAENSEVTLDNSTLSFNSAFVGGGIAAFEANVVINQSTVSRNQAQGDGGGIAANSGSVTVSNSTISGNNADNKGGAITVLEGTATIIDSTVTENQSSQQQAVFIDVSNGLRVLTVQNSIIAGNFSLGDLGFSGPVTFDVSSSLIGNRQGSTLSAAPVGSPDVNGNIIGASANPVDPLLGELSDNGGPTLTHALLTGSPAADAGDTTSTTDQRGLPRPGPGNNGPDIGAFEDQSLDLIVDLSNDVVDGDFSTGNLSLREAIQRTNASPGTDRISFDPEVFNGSANDVIRLVNGQLEITESVAIDAGDLQVVVSGDSQGDDVLDSSSFITDIAATQLRQTLDDNTRVFSIATAAGELVSLSGLTITGGNAIEGGGGITVSSAVVELTNVTIAGNRSDSVGGGISTDSPLTLNDSLVSGNHAAGGGGIYADVGVTLNDSVVSENLAATQDGGGISSFTGDVFLNSSTVENNVASDDSAGGGIATVFGAVRLIASSVNNNSSDARGGGISTESGNISLTDSSVSENESEADGGGIYTETGSISLTESTLDGNSTTGVQANGGGLATVSGTVSLISSTASNNQSSASGGGIYSETGSVSVFESTLAGNSTTGLSGNGGAIAIGSGSVVLTRSVASGNQSFSSGGGIYSEMGLVSLADSTISGNSTVELSSRGGGIASDSGVVNLIDSTVSGNSTVGSGGGIQASSGEVSITSSTVSGNIAQTFGGGISVGAADLSILSSTVAFNESTRPDRGGGLFKGAESATFEIKNSIIASNTSDGDASDLRFDASISLDLEFSLIGTNDFTPLVAAPVGSPDANGNLIGTAAVVLDPLLGDLSFYGGQTQTHNLIATSPAIDSGSSTLTNDQRGAPFVRNAGNGVDIGAFEFQRLELLVSTPVDTVDLNFSAGELSLREAIVFANQNPGEDLVNFDPVQFQGVASDDTIFLTMGELTVSESLQIDGEDLGIVISGDADGDDRTFIFTDITDPDFSSFAQRDDNSSVLNITAVAGDLVTLTGLTITGGLGGDFGGIANGAADLIIDRSTIAGNRSSNSGGGISNDSGTVTITRSTIHNNRTNRIGADGAGIHTVDGAISISLSTISGNQALQNGPSGGNGGGIASVNGDVLLDSVTLTDNSAAGEGGGIFVADSVSNPSLTLINTIVAGNEALGNRPDLGFDPDGFVDIQFSLIGDNSGTSLAAAPVGSPDADGNLIGNAGAVIDPLLGPLTNNFGPTLTHEVLPGSPAIDAGSSSFLTDQRDDSFFPRNDGSGVDIGSFERIVFDLVVDTASNVFDGDFSASNLSLPEAIFLSNNNPSQDVITFDSTVFNGAPEDVIRLRFVLIVDDGVIIDAGDSGVVISGDTAGNDVLVAGSNVTDIFASQTINTLNDNVQVFNINADPGDVVAINGLTITGGANTASGSGIRSDDSDLELTNSIIMGNLSSGNGGGITSGSGLLTINESIVSNNLSYFGPGGIFSDQGMVTLNDSSVANNMSINSSGGGIRTRSGDVLLNNSTVSGNSLGRSGGFSRGGGISTSSGDVTLFNSSVNDNTTFGNGDGGGINASFGSVSLTNSVVANNSTGQNGKGGGIHTITADVTLINSTVTNNSTGDDANGGGIHTTSGEVTLTNSTVANNSTGENADGGGIFTNSTTADVILTDSTVTNNTTGDGGDGGGIHTGGGDVTAIRSTISFNRSGDGGGGIESSFGELLFINSTISGNQSIGDGGGVNTVDSFNGNLLHLVNSTVTNNQSGTGGGGIHRTDSSFDTLIIENSIVAGNTTIGGIGPDLQVTSINEVRFSLIGSNSGTPLSSTGSITPDVNGNLIGSPGNLIAPLLGGLADNGGPTLTHGLLFGSPALNAGGSPSIDIGSIDQRGADRIQEGRVDIGSTEGEFAQLPDVIIASSGFSTEFIDAIDGGGSGTGNGLGHSLVGAQQLASVPWQNIDTLYLQFPIDVSASLEDGDVLLTGTNRGDYLLGPISYNSDSFVATIPIVGGIEVDSLVISIFAGSVTNSAGESVFGDDGEQFNFRFNVLPGDEDGSGQVTAQDAFNVFASNAGLTIPENARRDIDGSGQITAVDATATFANNTNGLPAPPTAPVPPAALTSVPRVTKIDTFFSEERLRGEPAREYVLIQTYTSKEVLPATSASDDVFVDPPLSTDISETPELDNEVFAKTPASVGRFTQSPVSESASIDSEPTQSMSLRSLLYKPGTVTASASDRITKTLSSEPSRLSLSPELKLTGHVEVKASEESQRDYFAGERQIPDEATTNVLDAIFQEDVSIDLEFEALR